MRNNYRICLLISYIFIRYQVLNPYQMPVESKLLDLRSLGFKILLLVIALCVLIGVIIAENEGDLRVLLQNITLVITSATAFALSVVVISRSITAYRKTFFMLLIGLALWCTAEVTWMYYVQVMKIEVPFPSLADLFYLSGYAFVGIFLMQIARRLAGTNKKNMIVISAVSISIVATTINFFIFDIVRDSFTVTSVSLQRTILLSFSVAYPILDALLLIPSMIILYESRTRKTEYMSWIMLSLAMLLLGIGDTGFGYVALKNIESLSEEYIWDIIFNFSYIFIIGSLAYEFYNSRRQVMIPQKE